jgi:ribokinase
MTFDVDRTSKRTHPITSSRRLSQKSIPKNFFDVVTFGSAVTDYFIETNLEEKHKEVCYPVGTKVLINSVRTDHGGGGVNTAVAFARLGFRVGMIGKFGNDTAREDTMALLKREGITFLGSTMNGASGMSLIFDSHASDRTVFTYKGPNNEVAMSEIKKFETNWLYYSALLEKSFLTQLALAKRMTQKGVNLAVNPSAYLMKKCDIRPLLKLTSVLILNLEEARLIVGTGNELAKLYALGPRIVVITDALNPVRVYDGANYFSITPHKHVKVVERTGAGDAFASGFVAGIMAGWTIDKSLTLGLAESESVIQYFGAQNILLRRKLK